MSVREDTIIQNDATVFPEWKQLSNFAIGAVVFADAEDRVTIMSVNRTRLETTLGVDLIYYHHSYHFFVLVQYKRFVDAGHGNFEYRPGTDSSLERELARMSHFDTATVDSATEEFRLFSRPCYHKALLPKAI